MKHFLLFLLSLFSLQIYSQSGQSSNDTTILTSVEEMPTFPGGTVGMMSYIQNQLIYPEAEKKAKLFGTCFVAVVIEKNGSISNPVIIRGVKNAPGFDQEALRIVNNMPKWSPGKQNGKEVRVRFNLPVKFILPVALNDTIYLDKDWKPSIKENAEFFRIISKDNYSYLVKDFYMKTKLPQMIGLASSIEPIVLEGKTTYYYDNGKKEEEGNLKKDRKVGSWIIWDEDGKDSSVLNYTD